MFRIRFGNFVPSVGKIDVYLGHKLIVSNLSYASLTSYLDFQPKKKEMHFIIKNFGTDEILCEGNVEQVKEKNNTMVVFLSNKKLKIKFIPTPFESVYSGKAELRFFHFAVNAPSVTVNVNNTTLFTDVSYEKTGKPLNFQYGLSRGLVYNDLKINLTRTNKLVIEDPQLYLKSGNIYSIFAHGIVGDANFPLKVTTFIDNPGLFDVLETDFDVQAYMNKWYQISSIPQPFTIGLNCANQNALYTYLSDQVKVYNSCVNQYGVVSTVAVGKAVIENPQQAAALTVSFPGFVPPPSQVGKFDPSKMIIPPGPNYLVHKTDYDNYAIVGSSDRSNLYILCRKNKMKREMYDELLRFCKKLGYNLNKLSLDHDTLY